MAAVGRNDPCPCGSGKKYKKCCGALSPTNPASPQPAAAPLPFGRLSTERAMAEMERLLADREFASLEEMNAYLQRAMAGPRRARPGPRTPLERAQELMYDAWEASGGRRVRLAREALALSPDCADAYVLLAEETAGSAAEARDLYAGGVAAGARALGLEAFEQVAGRFWNVLETRGYMRAQAGLASCLWLEGRRRDAIETWSEMLRLNPGDNQGVRYLLLAGLLEEGEDARAAALLKSYPGEGAASWAYARALLAFRSGGDTPQAKRARTSAIEANPHVPAYLTGAREPPGRMPAYVGIGDESEAVVCAAEQVAAWRRTPDALEWLERAAPGGRAGPPRAGTVYQLKVTLKGFRPPIWRRLLVPADTRLAKLHDVVQIAMGWTDSHLHQFEAGRRSIGVPDPNGWQQVEDERKVRLADVAPGEKARLRYQYDFGDSWEHEILVEKVLPTETGARYPLCTAGRRACPPEDVGGVWGYADFLDAIADPAHERHEELLEWIGGEFDPEAFDLAAINADLRRLR
jgi:tetratricopeptide (TPR) repeat protein